MALSPFFSDHLISYLSHDHVVPDAPPATLNLKREDPSFTAALSHWLLPLSGMTFSHVFISSRFHLKCHRLRLSSTTVSRNAPHVTSLF